MKERNRSIWKQALVEAGLILAICAAVVLADSSALTSPIRLGVMIFVLVTVPAVNAWWRLRHPRPG